MRTLYISLFGKFNIRYGEEDAIGFESKKQRELLCYLLVYRNRPHSREKLATMLWKDSSATQSKRYLRQAIWHLQSILNYKDANEKKIFLVESDWIQINKHFNFWLDIEQFEQISIEVNGTRGAELDSQAAEKIHDAIQLYNGNLLENWYQDWCIFERERFQNIFLNLLQKLIMYCEYQQAYEQGLAYGSLILQWDRACEKAYRQMMRLRYLAGDRTGAIRQYQRCVQVLNDELNVAPSSQTTSLYKAIQSDTFPNNQEISVRSLLPVSKKTISLSDVLHRLLLLSQLLEELQVQVQEDIQDVNLMLERNQI
ncbi:MAG: hypothetical protein DWQ04_04230 [Chloroflexi bacterium]|nr:MAG: hypothetical protein DWQ04_04230 [Chloroflexota bacterium]